MRLSQRLVLKYIKTKFIILSLFSKRLAAEKAFQLFCTPQYRNRKKLPRILSRPKVYSSPFSNTRYKVIDGMQGLKKDTHPSWF
jgi:hypothetical protein